MRYRIKEYSASVSNNVVTLSFDVPDGMVISIDPEDGSLDPVDERLIEESVRLIIDETNKVVLCSSMQKDSIINIEAQGIQGESTADTIIIYIAIPTGKTVSASDKFTIEFDWGESIGDVAAVLDYIEQGGMPAIAQIAKQGSNANTSLTDINTSVNTLTTYTNAILQNGAKSSEIPSVASIQSGLALQGSGNSTQTDIASAIGTPATGQPSTLFAAIAAGGGGGGGGGDATAANQQIIIASVKDNNDTAIDVVKDIDTYGAKEAAATANKNQVISAIGDTLSVNMLATGLSAMAGVPMNVVTDDGTTAYTLNANELYYFNNRSSDLELTLDLTTVNTGDAADFHLIVQVDANASPLTVTIKDSDDNDVVWARDSAPYFSAGGIYEIGIINNLALSVSYAV